jgi:hypothetical protein
MVISTAPLLKDLAVHQWLRQASVAPVRNGDLLMPNPVEQVLDEAVSLSEFTILMFRTRGFLE